ncbi:MAG: UDP-N-acetylmuramoyl-L-alanyl-D-glutamate--2,6-diaminopimelate ligase [Deferrisomatales bacterium]|nr:UDP-N-acetylmuramoyl-L-alanyl-D-glutamate--2,6-diaminopimelate ligase [Deferrisomatales bacterium]
MTETRLSDLLRCLPGAIPLDTGDPVVTGVACDTRTLAPGHLFVAVRGTQHDGHGYLGAAAAAGAAACLVEEARPAPGLVRVRVDDTEAALGRAASAFWGHPSRKLRLVGITGTNGKTTTAYLLQHVLAQFGESVGRLGTVSYAFPGGEEPAPLTTPDAPTLQAALARMVAEGANSVVMEVSSHALHRKRVEGCAFQLAVFTNLTQDHLDYHGTMDAYYEAKRLLFHQCVPGAVAVINAEDPFGERLAGEVPGRVVRYGLAAGDVRLEVLDSSLGGLRGRVHYPGGAAELVLPLVGEFNARNAACALAAVWALGLDLPAAAAALSTAPQVPGRGERVENTAGFTVVVDYAHTHDALDRVLEAVRALCRGRLTCVFGCGGDRDRGKRPLMAKAAARWSDAVVLTADNSRSEDTEEILDEIEIGLPVGWCRVEEAGLAQGSRVYARIADRAAAIRAAVAAARSGDLVVIAGKGHEATQTIGGRVTAFDDRVHARAALATVEGV